VTRALLALALGAAAVLIAFLVNRRRVHTSLTPGVHVPAKVARTDFAEPDAPALVVVFTSQSCVSCAAMLSAAEAVRGEKVAVDEAEIGARPDLHERYEIDAVPIALVVDRSGTVRASFAGSVTADELRDALASVTDHPAT
jgi:hypothetical protein